MTKTETKPEAETTPAPKSTRVSDPELVGFNRIISTFEALPSDEARKRALAYLWSRYVGAEIKLITAVPPPKEPAGAT